MTPPSKTECINSQFCTAHEFNTAELNKHRGYWKLVITFSATFMSALIAFGAWQVNQTQTMRSMVASLDSTVAALVAVSQEQRHNTEIRLDKMDSRLDTMSAWYLRDDLNYPTE
jgi:anti-sigma-K factor RskA